MLLVLSITFYFHYNIWGCVCSTGPFQFRWLKGYIYSSCYYHHQIGSIHLSHCYHIFPWFSARDVCCIIFSHLMYIRSGKTGNLFSFLLCSLWWVQIFGYILACRSYSFVCAVHHPIIIIVQTYLKALNACHIYFVECVSKIKHFLSVIHYIIYVGLYVFSLLIYLVMIERIYMLCFIIIIESEVWTITHCLGLGHEIMVSAICLFIFFLLPCLCAILGLARAIAWLPSLFT